MTNAIKAFVSNSIDYAGIYPPAALPFQEAAKNYSRYLHGDKKWILNNFICPFDKLDELRDFLENSEENLGSLTWPISVLGKDFLNPEPEIEKIDDFVTGNDFAEVMAYEMKADINQINLTNLDPYSEAASDIDAVYIELPWEEGLYDALHTIAEDEIINAKVRTGGMQVSMVPKVNKVAKFIQECANIDVGFKFTAGLHSPLFGQSKLDGKELFGFLNMMVATALLDRFDLTLDEIEQVLVEKDISNFTFTDKEFGWRDMTAKISEIDGARSIFPSFGSCSIDEPLEGLVKLGLIEKGEAA